MGRAFLGPEATEENYKKYALNSYVIHFSGHAFTNDSIPLYSGLALTQNTDSSEDGFLHAYEIYNQSLQAELAVLSACKTGIGKQIRGEGVMSLARAFHYAGCPNIAMSLWPADDKATKELMIEFHKQLKAGKAKDEALRQAKLYVLDKHKSHPFYWGAFVLIGDNAPVHFNTSYWWLAWSLGGILVLIAIYWFLQRRKSPGKLIKK